MSLDRLGTPEFLLDDIALGRSPSTVAEKMPVLSEAVSVGLLRGEALNKPLKSPVPSYVLRLPVRHRTLLYCGEVLKITVLPLLSRLSQLLRPSFIIPFFAINLFLLRLSG